MVYESIKKAIREALTALGAGEAHFVLERASAAADGADYATNAALVAAPVVGKSPRDVSTDLVSALENSLQGIAKSVRSAGPGFVNITLKDEVIISAVTDAAKQERYGESKIFSGEKIIVEYTDPNPFKLFHIGHLMSNTIGESLARLFEWGGAELKRANYQGDVGLHVAKALWGLKKEGLTPTSIENLGIGYASGARAYEEDEGTKAEIAAINKAVYEKSDAELTELYTTGKKVSLEYFEKMYSLLGTHFDYYFFESEVGQFGKEVVEKNIGSVFRASDGAIIYPGEEDGLHTRVFINREGLPTYEAKELGLAKKKYDEYPYTRSIVITGSEITEYFRVLLAALTKIFPDLAKLTEHVPHGMLRLPSGKMSSRTGDIITAQSLIEDVESRIQESIEGAQHSTEAAIAAIKYSILKQGIGHDIIFDTEKSISLTGDSGPYLQYAHARANSVLAQKGSGATDAAEEPAELERLIMHFPEEVERAVTDYAPQRIVSFLNEVAQAFNAYYAQNRIIGSENEPYRLALTAATRTVIRNGLAMLGIRAPERM